MRGELTLNHSQRPAESPAIVPFMVKRTGGWKPTGKKRTAPEVPLGNRLAEFMEARQLTVSALSDMTMPRISKSAVQRHASGETQMTISHMEVYARALGIFAEELLPGDLRLLPEMRQLIRDLSLISKDAREAFQLSIRQIAERTEAANATSTKEPKDT